MEISINETLRDDELRSILGKLESDQDNESFGLVCKRWLHMQSFERRASSACAEPHILRRIAARFSGLHELDLSQSVSRSFYTGVTDSDLAVIAGGFASLRVLNLRNCKDEFKPASIDKTKAGSMKKTKENRVSVEFQNNQIGKPKVTFEGSSEDYKESDAVGDRDETREVAALEFPLLEPCSPELNPRSHRVGILSKSFRKK